MTDYELARTFFPGSRKELIISAITLLQTKAGENRIKLGLTMPLSDGKLVGMPGWIGDSYDVIGKADSLLMSDKWGHDIKEMTYTVYGTEDAQKPAQLAVCPLMNAFSLRRGVQEEDVDELSDVCLHFVAYLNDNTELWAWCRRLYRKSIFVKFETTQAELPLGDKDDKQLKLVGDAERKEATRPAHDAEFAGVGKH
jgi:hypothetical protein